MVKIFHVVVLSLLLALMVSESSWGQTDPERDDLYRIKLGMSDFTPVDGARSLLQSNAKHIVLQLYNIPDAAGLARLEREGITLQSYIGSRAYIAKVTKPEALDTVDPAVVRATINLSSDMKLSRKFKTNHGLSNRLKNEETLDFDLSFQADVSAQRIHQLLSDNGINPENYSYQFGNTYKVTCSWELIRSLANLDEAAWVDPALPKPILLNRVAAERSRVEQVRQQKLFKKADGKNAIVGIWDEGPIGQHVDLDSRVTNIENSEAVSSHATHVAGTIAGSGELDGSAEGMAPMAKLYGYDYTGSASAEMAQAEGQYGIMITNNSWGYAAGWEANTDDPNNIYYSWVGDWQFGYYHQVSSTFDQMIRYSNLLVVFAAANDRNDFFLGEHKHNQDQNTDYSDIHPADPDYGSVGLIAAAKNVLTVGATMKDDLMTGFSDWGPTADGRLKPDVVANGYQLYSTQPGNSYGELSGTSMATPVVSGTAALLLDYYELIHKARISGLMLKNLLIHSARDLGKPGPDYEFGNGIVDAEYAARVIRKAVFDNKDWSASPVSPAKKFTDENMTSMMIEGSLGQGNKKKFVITLPEGIKELRATLVWNDLPGPMLINNLDLYLKARGVGKVSPFILDKNNPAAPATTGTNNTDNVENVLVKNPKSGKWKIFLKGSTVPLGPQKYTLIVSASDGNRPPEMKTEGTFTLQRVITSSSSDWDNITEKNSFTDGDDFWCYAFISVPQNADYGGYYGTMLAHWSVTDQNGSEVIKSNYASDGFYPRENLWRWRLGKYDIPSGLPAGTYKLEVTITMHTGESQKADYTFTIQ